MTKKEIQFKLFILDLKEFYFEFKTELWGIIFPIIVGYFFGVSASAALVAFAFNMFSWNNKKAEALEVLKYAFITTFVIISLFLGATILAIG